MNRFFRVALAALIASTATGLAPALAVAPEPVISTLAGSGAYPEPPVSEGDGGPAMAATFVWPSGVAADSRGNVYVADYTDGRVRRISPDGLIDTVVGGGEDTRPADGSLATDARMHPREVAVDADDNLYVAADNIYKVMPGGRIYHVAGASDIDYSGDGGPAVDAGVGALDVAVSPTGDVYIADYANHRIRLVTPHGIISTVAGTGVQGSAGDGGPADAAELDAPVGVALDSSGNLFISQTGRIRKVTPEGTISTFAGGGSAVDAELATDLRLARPKGLALDPADNLYVADHQQHLVRRITPEGVVSVVVGNITHEFGAYAGFQGDGDPATDAKLRFPRGVAIGGKALYVADNQNFRVRMVRPLPGIAAVDDFNDDGTSDLVWRHRVEGHDQVWRGARSGDRQQMRAVRNVEWDVVATGDFDGDAVSDVFWRNVRTGANAIWPGAAPARTPVRGVANGEWLVETAGDFDGDGRDDLFWRNMINGTNAIWPGGQPGDVQVVAIRNEEWHVAGAGDFDGDGEDDLLWRNPYTGQNVIWRSALYATQQVVEPMTAVGWTVAGIGDFGGDGRDDVLWRNYETGENVIWPGGNAAQAQAVASVAKVTWIVAAVGDYDGDGDADILWRDRSSGRNVIWRDADHREQRAVGSVSDQSWQIVPTTPIECDARRAQWAIGRTYTTELGLDIRSAVRARTMRPEPNGRVTLPDYESDRVRIGIDDADGNVVWRVVCG